MQMKVRDVRTLDSNQLQGAAAYPHYTIFQNLLRLRPRMLVYRGGRVDVN